ncbi:MAG: SDR family oxidoreductase [Deltaproteobacteria bacterium]|nr:SDR family oxidoreductase [Deltaproteobacteria bacterium]
MQGSLEGKVALVTGASRGIGRAVALELARQGARLAVHSRSAGSAAPVAAELKAAGAEVIALPGLLETPGTGAGLVRQAAARFGRIDIVVNNAGINIVRSLGELTRDQFLRVLEVNLLAPFEICSEAMKLMTAQKGGVIINVSSVSAKLGLPKFPGFAAYSASKYGLQGLTDVAHVEGKPHGVRVVAIQLGSVRTDMLRETLPDAETALDPAEVARVAVFACSDAGASLAGTTVEMWP